MEEKYEIWRTRTDVKFGIGHLHYVFFERMEEIDDVEKIFSSDFSKEKVIGIFEDTGMSYGYNLEVGRGYYESLGLYENTGKDISDTEQLSFKDNYEVMCDAIRDNF